MWFYHEMKKKMFILGDLGKTTRGVSGQTVEAKMLVWPIWLGQFLYLCSLYM